VQHHDKPVYVATLILLKEWLLCRHSQFVIIDINVIENRTFTLLPYYF
jgi:hypothetical protein